MSVGCASGIALAVAASSLIAPAEPNISRDLLASGPSSSENPFRASSEQKRHDEESHSLALEASLLDSPKAFVAAFAGFLHYKAGCAARRNTHSTVQETRPTVFHGIKTTAIPIKEYIRRIARHSKCSPVCFVGAFAYIQRLTEAGSVLKLCARSVHRLLIAGVVIAAKLMDDKFYSNAFYARIGGISNEELNRLELEMLRLLDFRAFVSHSEVRDTLAIITGEGHGVAADGTCPADCSCRRNKKRASLESPKSSFTYPTKLLHDSNANQVLVTREVAQSKQQSISGPGSKTGLIPADCKAETWKEAPDRHNSSLLPIRAGGE